MKHHLFAYFLLCCSAASLQAQLNLTDSPNTNLKSIILEKDSLFWIAYNECDTETMSTMLSDDLEFYHDKGGLTTTGTTLISELETGICGNNEMKLERRGVEGSIKIFPIRGIGALISGEHTFHIHTNDGTINDDGRARFFHLWEYKSNQWKMTRVFSYDHVPFDQTNQ